MSKVVLVTLVAALLVRLAYFYADRRSEQAKRDNNHESSQRDDNLT